MKNKLKQILLIVSMVLTLLLSCVPLSAFAASSSIDEDSKKYTITLDEMQKENSGQYYVYYNYWVPWSGGYHSQVYYFYTDTKPSYEKSGNTYTISFSKSPQYSYYLLRDTGSAYDQRKGYNSSIETITYNADTHEVTYTGGGFSGFEQISSGPTFIDFQTNIFDLGQDKMIVSVDFTPSLMGNVDRTVSGSVSEDLEIKVKNESNFGIQYLFAILPSDKNIHFYEPGAGSTSAISYVYDPLDPVYVYWSQEWNYFYQSDITASDSGHAHHPDYASIFKAVKTLSSCPWHYVGKGETVTHKFKWSQINLKTDTKYTVKVFAVRNDYNLASRQAQFEDGDYYVDYSAIDCVYASGFTLTNGYTYNPKDTSYGNILYNSTSDLMRDSWASSATEDEDGKLDVTQKDLSWYFNNHKYIEDAVGDWKDNLTYTYPSYGTSPGSSSFRFSGLLDTTSSFFTFISNSLGFFPSIILEVISLALVSFLVLAIIRRLH